MKNKLPIPLMCVLAFVAALSIGLAAPLSVNQAPGATPAHATPGFNTPF